MCTEEVYVAVLTTLSFSAISTGAFWYAKKLDISKMIKAITAFFFFFWSYLNFPPKHLTKVFLAEACFSFQSNEKHFLPFELLS